MTHKRSATLYLKNAERTVVLIASLVAILPLWQIYSEADERKLDRAANFVLAYSVCSEFQEAHAAEVEALVDAEDGITLPIGSEGIVFEPDGNFDAAILQEFQDKVNDTMKQYSEQIANECNYIARINRPEITVRQ